MESGGTPSSRFRSLPVALAIAGSDSGGGAGIQADLLSFAAAGVYGTTAITCLTAQSPREVADVLPVTPPHLLAQIETVFGFFRVRAVKTGMLFNAELVDTTAAALARRPRTKLVVDPVMVATSGAVLLKPEAVRAITSSLFPLATLITPNLDEAAVLLGRRPEGLADLRAAAETLAQRYHTAVLLKGGHLRGDRLHDVLCLAPGRVHTFTGVRVPRVNTHGSGCTLSASIAAHLARGADLVDAVKAARRYLRAGLRRPLMVSGRRFIAH